MPSLLTPMDAGTLLTTMRNAACTTEACISNWKITFSILLVVESLIFGHIVLLVRAFSCIAPSTLLGVMRYGSAVAGGIFLSTGLLHIVPEALENYEVNAASTVDSHAGHTNHTGHDHSAHGHLLVAAANATSGGGVHAAHEIKFPVVFTIVLASFYLMLMLEHVLIASCQHKGDPDYEDNVSFDPDRSESVDLEVFGATSLNLANAIGTRDGHPTYSQDNNTSHEEDYLAVGNGYQSRAFVAALVVTMGVAAHSILESIALGAASKFSDVLNLFIAIASHRWATAAALGIRYARAGLAAGPVVLLVFVFSFIAPIGVGFGFLAVGGDHTMAQSVLFSMAAGTFIFLGASATIVVDDSTSQFKMYLASAVGASLMLIVTAVLVVKKIH